MDGGYSIGLGKQALEHEPGPFRVAGPGGDIGLVFS